MFIKIKDTPIHYSPTNHSFFFNKVQLINVLPASQHVSSMTSLFDIHLKHVRNIQRCAFYRKPYSDRSEYLLFWLNLFYFIFLELTRELLQLDLEPETSFQSWEWKLSTLDWFIDQKAFWFFYAWDFTLLIKSKSQLNTILILNKVEYQYV